MNTKLTINEKITDLRMQAGLSQKELCAAIGIPASSLSRIERGEITNVSNDILVKLAKYFRVSTDYLLGMTKVTTPKNAELEELGLSNKALLLLLSGKVDGAMLSRLMEHPRFALLLDAINSTLDEVEIKAGRLQGEVNQQNRLIRKTIQENCEAINNFLRCAGYGYQVKIVEEDSSKPYKMLLYPIGIETNVDSVKKRLSYGEKNALALVLFMFSAIKCNPDLIILDDPISSFDGNKKFAIINMLFFHADGFDILRHLWGGCDRSVLVWFLRKRGF